MERTINEVFKNRANKYSNRIALEKKKNGAWQSATWTQYYENARAAGLGFASLGVERGDRIGIFSDNYLEWLYSDMGGLGIGAVVVPLYPTLTEEEAGYIVQDSGCKALIVGDKEQLEKAKRIRAANPSLQAIVTIGDVPTNGDGGLISFARLMEIGLKKNEQDPGLFERSAAMSKPGDLATIVYTSGTTGMPKGVMITHQNIMFVIQGLAGITPGYADEKDQTVPFLPLCHVFGRIADHYMGMYAGITASFAENFTTLLEDLQERRPTIIMAVPRVCEKVFQKIMEQVETQPLPMQKIFYWSQKIGEQVSELREAKKPVPLVLALKYRLAYQLVFKKLQDRLGGRVKYIMAAGGPTAREIQLFFNAAGISVVEGYGLTETTAPAALSNLSDYRIGTVGPPLPGVDVKIAQDGEVLIKGDNVFTGYWNLEQETRRAFTEDGYFMSGDLGELDDRGFLKITGRKKDLIITAGGKNIAPQKIESLFMSDPLFLHFIVIGDRRKYLSALVNINMEQAQTLAEKEGIAYSEPRELLDNPEFLAIVDRHVAERNSHLARFETIKQYRIIKDEFSQESGEMTASLKLKRNVINEKYNSLVEGMYPN
ncbi:AMP-dependent synthetase/ligase [Desulfatibacillum aliphaticivorans]|uniref:AMP-dependent synthetase/ligase n=1 Tax=Desulfatibacillum aliphaticivorans TaxID=218208 RepID=UPI000417E40B|nr:long-chain fatty acid--CoA ligase [Desulfatibacillum aliphaticivorans]